MTKLHEEILELAAASIDFPLTTEEADQVAAHLRGCPSCRGRVEAISSDQRAIAALQPIAIDGAHATAIWTGVRRRRTPAPPLVRVVLLAAALALLALAAAAVGGALLRDAGPRLGISGPSTDQAAVIVPSSTPVSTAATPGSFAEGAFVDVSVTGLRVRTAPTVDNAKSAKLEPLLGVGTHLKVLNGPVQADGYAWYEVQALDLPHHGWVAAADHDGEPWILSAAGADPTPSFSPVEEALARALRPDSLVDCVPRRSALPSRSTVGIDCGVSGAVATKVGAYQFNDAGDAARTYLERIASYDVKPASGSCGAGSAGDAPWLDKDGEPAGPKSIAVSGSGTRSVGRIGCFLNENDVANVRVTCGSVYVGILGVDGDLAALSDWAWSTSGQPEPGSRPSICGLLD